jgi:proline iminopeptidase
VFLGTLTYLLSIGIKINGLVGHSYGAKLLYDFFQQVRIDVPGIFLSTADSILIPRLNNLNLNLDLNYLKKIILPNIMKPLRE